MAILTFEEKLRIRQTLTFLTDVDSSTDTLVFLLIYFSKGFFKIGGSPYIFLGGANIFQGGRGVNGGISGGGEIHRG